MADEKSLIELYQGLQFIVEASFPKKCTNCGKVYQTADEFLTGTRSIRGLSGLKQSYDDDDSTCVELFRNCECGSTLMEICRDRRDTSERGLKRREIFGQLLVRLNEYGIDTDTARAELLKVMRGEESALLKGIGINFDSGKL